MHIVRQGYPFIAAALVLAVSHISSVTLTGKSFRILRCYILRLTERSWTCRTSMTMSS